MTRAAPKILVSYRRSDSAAMTGRIVDQLMARYGAAAVFMDVDNIPIGVDFRDHIRGYLADTDVVLAIVGLRWRGAGEQGARILAADDPVRLEIELAFAGAIPVIPVLVDGATMPAAAELPEAIQKISFINAAPVDTGRDFRHHVDVLIDSLDRLLETKYQLPPRPGSEALLSLARLKSEVRRPAFWGLIGALLLPFPAALMALAPPWPPGVTILTIAAVLLTYAFVRYRLRSVSPAAVNRVAAISAAVLAVSLGAYLLALSLYTFQTPTTKERFATGLTCTAEALAVFKDKCPSLGMDELRLAEYDAERLWTAGSLATVRIGLLALWLTAFIALGGVTASVAGAQARRTAAVLA